MKEKITGSFFNRLFILMVVFFFLNIIIFLDTNFYINNDDKNIQDINNSPEKLIDIPKLSTDQPNSRPLQITQHAKVSKSIYPLALPENISFVLTEGWISENQTILYEGISQKNNRVNNSEFLLDNSSWDFKTNSVNIVNDGWKSDHSGSMRILIEETTISQGEHGYYEQNLTISEPFSNSELAIFSFDYRYYRGLLGGIPENMSVYMAIIIDGNEYNESISTQSIDTEYNWRTISIIYDPFAVGHILPGNVLVRIGIYTDNDTTIKAGFSDYHLMDVDNIKYDIWTNPKDDYILNTFDIELNKNHTFQATDYGKGFSFIDVERIYNETKNVEFSVYQNTTDVEDFKVYNITITSFLKKMFYSNFNGYNGSYYKGNGDINWETHMLLTNPYNYFNNWLEVEKPSDWEIIHAFDGYALDKITGCIGTGIGSQKLVIDENIYTTGLWKIEAISQNYISDGYLGLWNGTNFKKSIKISMNDIFRINIILNDTIILANSEVECAILYPNGSILWQGNQEPISHYSSFGNFTVGRNMTVGTYNIQIQWKNGQNISSIDKVGFKEFEFTVWHHSNLTAIDSYFEIFAGDPLLLKVKFMDDDFNSPIEFADVNYSSTFGQFGTMVYIGSGIYFTEIDTDSLELGDYYFSFSAKKTFYNNQTINNLIHLKIIPEPLALELSDSIIETNANTIVSCQVNITGSITKTLLWAVNVSTDWFNPYNVNDHDNGTYTLDFSTENIPTSGYLESYTIEIFANKTGYGNSSTFLTLLVHPIPTFASVNTSLISVYQDEVIKVRVNYTDEVTNELISGANCTVSWEGSHLITPISNEFEITLNTTGLIVGYYTALITCKRAGYETAFTSITVIINEKEVQMWVSINRIEINESSLVDVYFQQQINISVRISTIIEPIYLSGGVVTLISDYYQVNLTESPSTYFNTSIILDGAYFDSGINNILLRFQQTNYSTSIFAFQLFIRAQSIDLIVQINNQDILENYLFEISYNQIFHLSCRAFAEIDAKYLSGGTITFVNNEHEIELIEYEEYWFNSSILVSALIFSIGPNYAYLRFQQSNYTTTTFSLQIFVNQIEIEVEPLNFEDVIGGIQGDDITIQLRLTENLLSEIIVNATIFYSWDFGNGYFEYISNGTYESKLNLPTGYSGNYPFTLVISMESSIYKSLEYSIIINIIQREIPNYFLWIIIILLIAITSIFGALVIRNYVFLPRKRKKNEELLDKIQVYKDLKNIQALMLIQKDSGLPIYTQEIRIFESDDDSFLLAGLIQAITNFSEVLIQREFTKYQDVKSRSEYSKYIIELDFNMFQLLACDYNALRILVFLREKSSERLKKQLYLLNLALNSQFKEEFAQYSGDIHLIKKELIDILNQFLFLHYIEKFKVNEDKTYVDAIINSGELPKMAIRLYNVILSITKESKEFNLQEPIELIYEKNEDLVLDALDTLIKKKLIISTYYERKKLKN